MRCPGSHHMKTDTLKGLRCVQNQSHSPLIFCFCLSIKSLHFHQYFPHRLLSCSTSPVGMSASGLSLVTFFGIKKNIVVQACCGHLTLILRRASTSSGILGSSACSRCRTCRDYKSWLRFSPCGAHRLQMMTLAASCTYSFSGSCPYQASKLENFGVATDRHALYFYLAKV